MIYVIENLKMLKRMSGFKTARNLNISCKTCSSNQNQFKSDGYVTVYKFPYIRHVAVFNKLKMYQTLLTAATIPANLYMVPNGILEYETATSATYLGISICLWLYGISILTNKVVGFVYWNKEKESVKIAHVDFWGNRKEKEILLRDIVPISDMSIHPKILKYYFPLKQYSEKGSFKLVTKFGNVVLEKDFNKIFLFLDKQ